MSKVDQIIWKDKEFSLASYFVSLWWRRKVILIILGVGFFLGVVVPLLMPKKYASSITFVAADKTGGDSGLSLKGNQLAMLSSALSLASGGTPGDSSFYLALITSARLLDLVTKDTALHEHYGLPTPESARGNLAKSVFTKIQLGGILQLTVFDSDPEMARKLADSFLKNLNVLLNSMTLTAAGRHTQFLEERLRTAEAELFRAEEELTDFQKEKRIILPEVQLRSGLAMAASLESSLVSERLRLRSLLQVENRNSPNVKELRSNIDSLQAQLNNIYTTDVPKAAKSGKNGKAVSGEAISRLLTSPELITEFNQHQRQVEVREVVYTLLLQEYELSQANAAKEKRAVEVIDHAEVSSSPAKPNSRMIFLICFALSIVFAMVYPLLQTPISHLIADVKTTNKKITEDKKYSEAS